MIIENPTKFKSARLVAISHHQQVWKLGWTTPAPSYPAIFTKARPTCNYLRCLHDGRIMESFAYPREADEMYYTDWPLGFNYAVGAQFHNEWQRKTEEALLRRELVSQLIGVIKFGQQQHQKALELMMLVTLERQTRPESNLAILLNEWQYKP